MQQQPQRSILIHYGELGLKGKNQPQFRWKLRDNIVAKLKSLGLNWPVKENRGSICVDAPADAGEAADRAVEGLRQVFGIAWLTPAIRLPHLPFTLENEPEHLAAIEEHLIQIARAEYAPDKTFAVRTKRADKRFSIITTKLDTQLGGAVWDNTDWKKVNLKHPDVMFQVEIRRDASYVFSRKLKGAGGLPVGTAGRVVVLLSGGIDSPVAAYLIAKRGCHVDFLHFTAASVSAEQAKEEKIFRLARHLSQYTGSSRLFLVPYTFFDFALLREQLTYDLVLFRRFMVRVAEKLAGQLKAQAIVTGDNLSQVASQTLPNIVATSSSSQMPVLRPVLTYDKEEIMAVARQIGTYDISIECYKDCCALIAQNPKTSSRHDRLEALEKRVLPDYDNLIDQTLKDAVCLEPAKT